MKTSQISEVLWLFMDNRQDPECKEKVLCMFLVEQGTYLSLRDPVDDFPIFQNSQGKQLKFKVIPMGVCLFLLQTAGTYCHQPEDWTAKSFSQIWRLDVQGYQEILLPGSWMIPFYLLPYMAEGRGSSWACFIRSTIPWMGSLPKIHLLMPYSEEQLRWQNLEGTKAAVLLWQPWSHLAQKRNKR